MITSTQMPKLRVANIKGSTVHVYDVLMIMHNSWFRHSICTQHTIQHGTVPTVFPHILQTTNTRDKYTVHAAVSYAAHWHSPLTAINTKTADAVRSAGIMNDCAC